MKALSEILQNWSVGFPRDKIQTDSKLDMSEALSCSWTTLQVNRKRGEVSVPVSHAVPMDDAEKAPNIRIILSSHKNEASKISLREKP